MAQPGTGKVAAAMFAMTCTLIATLVALFVMTSSMFPWMTVLNRTDRSPAPTQQAVPVDVTDGRASLAERTVRRVMATKAGVLGAAGWQETAATAGVPGVSFGFGCDPADGLAPVVAASRAWTRSGRALEVSARAYPAGGGAAAFRGVTDAVLSCAAASLFTGPGLGVESAQVVTNRGTALLWRRGDVLMVATTSGSSVTALLPGLTEFDTALARALAPVCADPTSGVSDVFRSPYLNRNGYRGHFEQVRVVKDPQPKRLRAERRTDSPPVPVPARSLPVPALSVLPTPPVPAITDGPTALPEPVAAPAAPVAPTEQAAHSKQVDKQVADPDGPGCGWGFTGQVEPPFDAEAAEAAHREAVAAAKATLAASWRRWQAARADYFDSYATYRQQVGRYRRYANQVTETAAAWAVVETARSNYYTALAAYEAALEAFERWASDLAQAREEFGAAKKECRALAAESAVVAVPRAAAAPTSTPTSTPSSTQTPTPTSSPTVPPTSKPTGKPTSIPTPAPTEDPTTPPIACPPVRPAILDSTPPPVPPAPVPAPDAQLPLAEAPDGEGSGAR